MSFSKPFHRNVRAMKSGPDSSYSGWAYIYDRDYASNPEHYVRAFILIQNDLKLLFEYLEPSDECRSAYSYRIHALLMRTCIEVEANFKAILGENASTSRKQKLNIHYYRKIDVTHHLSSYKVMLPIWNGASKFFKPFERWRSARGLPASGVADPGELCPSWYQAYNASKHDRQDEFKKASFENLVTAVAGLLVLISSQFRDLTFSAGSMVLGLDQSYDYHPMEPATGGLFRIEHPSDWTDDERYDFDWSLLKVEKDRFDKFNYDAIPY